MAETSKFGGIPVEDSPVSQFGGIPVSDHTEHASAPGNDHPYRDLLQHEGFLESAWDSLTSLPSSVYQMASGGLGRQSQEEQKQIENLRANGTTQQRREFAKEQLLKNIPFASTVYKAFQGNLKGAAGDVAGVLPYAALGTETGRRAVAVTADEMTPGFVKRIATRLREGPETAPSGEPSETPKLGKRDTISKRVEIQHLKDRGPMPTQEHASQLAKWMRSQGITGAEASEDVMRLANASANLPELTPEVAQQARGQLAWRRGTQGAR